MPLVLSVRQGDDFYVSDQQFRVSRIYDETSFTLVNSEGGEFEITESKAEEVMPEVFVSAGDLFQRGIVRAVIDAPRDMLILRGDKFRHEGT